jgi:subtilase family serine protease
MQRFPNAKIVKIAAILTCALPFTLAAQTPRRPLIQSAIDATKLHRLAGNTRPEANAANDAGAVPDSLAMDHMLLQLQRSAAQDQAAAALVRDLHDPKSPQYHKWLTAAQYAESFGLAQQDIDTITSWLRGQGFTVNSIYPNGLTIDFSGTAGQVARAFHTSMHYLDVGGRRHVANMSDPQIPAALAPAVAGIASLHDFTPRAQRKARPAFTYGNGNSTMWAVTPSDLATIYNLNPLFAAGITGKGQTVAVIEDADDYSASDFTTFRATLGLNSFSSGSLSLVHPTAGLGSSCTDPGTRTGDDIEATLDAEWASAAAPDATIALAACSSSRTTWGGLIALANLINGANPPNVISVSYGECEALNGAALNNTFSALYQQAVTQGISVFVSAGDEGAAACDSGSTGATHGIAVSGWASTPYNVAVGGTDFGDTYAGTNQTYWNSTNDSNFASALSYVPEIPWNDSCANGLLAASLGYTSGYGSDGLCGSADARRYGLLQVAAGSGGPSACATGNSAATGIVGGTCQGYAKPDWQTGAAGIPADGVRDLPDVSLFAGTGLWGHYYVFCYTNTRNGGASCDGDPSTWAGAGGTSFGSPIMAGIQALINQKTGSNQGNPNYAYYRLASSPGAVCDSTAGDNPSSSCIFHNVTLGDIAVNCGGNQNCFGDTGSVSVGRRSLPAMTGALSVSTDNYTPAFGTASGWNFATGLGTPNVANLVNNWPQ